jgi:energy-coupling factor transport system ATP-binding protein
LRAQALGFTYRGSSGRALHGLDLEVGPGQLLVLAGPSGGGKSTAALGLAGLLGDPVDGRVEGEVVPVGDEGGAVGLVLQDPDSHLVTLTVRDEVAFGPENLALPRVEILGRLEAALDAVGSSHLADRPTNELSGGEKQRVAIASVLAMEPEHLVLDEPTANLDPEGRTDVLDLALELSRGGERGVVVSEHRLDRLAEAAVETVVLAAGEVLWRGDHDELQANAEELTRAGVRVPGRPDLLGLDRREVAPGGTVLRVEGLDTGYGGKLVLDGLDLVVRAGEMVGLVGPNGGGKTTLLRCILGLGDVWEGRVEVAGIDASASTTSDLARRAGLVFQTPDHQLFERTVRAEMEFGPRNLGLLDGAMAGRIEALASEYALSPLMDVHPFRLSLGQKRRLNVASVQATSPRLLMLDEPFIGQDLGSIQALNQRFQAATEEGTAVLLVTHDLEALSAVCDRIIVLDGGRAEELDDPVSLSEGIPWSGAS